MSTPLTLPLLSRGCLPLCLCSAFRQSHGNPGHTTAAWSFPSQHHSRGSEQGLCPFMVTVTKYFRLRNLKTIGISPQFHLSAQAAADSVCTEGWFFTVSALLPHMAEG